MRTVTHGLARHQAEGRHTLAVVACLSVALTTGVLALVATTRLDLPLLDPEGSFLGPSWLRLPILLALCVVLDTIPPMLWHSRLRRDAMVPALQERLHHHWTPARLALVGVGVASFYLTYVGYRNLKSALPFARDFNDPSQMFDRELNTLDRVLFFGNQPGPVLHDILGTGIAAHVLSTIYLVFLPLVPILVMVWVVWSPRIAFGYWFVLSQCLTWALGTASYYALPTLGPVYYYAPGYTDLSQTGTTSAIESLRRSRDTFLNGAYDGTIADNVVNSVAGFASLHTAVTLAWALIVQFTIHSRWIKRIFWINFAATIDATIYFGWHYVADDVAGIAIALVAVYVAALAVGRARTLEAQPSRPEIQSPN